MFSDDLFDNILLSPAVKGADHLYVISGYATAAMAFHHINYVRSQGHSIKVDLVVGMCPNDGLSVSNHKGFKKLVEDDFAGAFECSYVMTPPAVHSKVYIWTKKDQPIFGFAGSANYTQNAFRSKQREAMASCNANAAFDYFQQLIADTIYCTHNDAENFIQLFKDNYSKKKQQLFEQGEFEETTPAHIIGLPKITISLLTNDGTLPRRSGLNWGQRPDQNREPNQAYIRLPASVYHTNFFPENTIQFTVLTDDGKTIICTRAQQNGKAIHTPHNNSLIGEYFRNRLGLASGALVTEKDLATYG
ncbi:MAG: NgoFVII family restriction endonuclease, partial [Deltaproteobacteria bacterium]|nr:NgoFVII family restriction endonuclease [Deltaproteobacteria bacterium]